MRVPQVRSHGGTESHISVMTQFKRFLSLPSHFTTWGDTPVRTCLALDVPSLLLSWKHFSSGSWPHPCDNAQCCHALYLPSSPQSSALQLELGLQPFTGLHTAHTVTVPRGCEHTRALPLVRVWAFCFNLVICRGQFSSWHGAEHKFLLGFLRGAVNQRGFFFPPWLFCCRLREAYVPAVL